MNTGYSDMHNLAAIDGRDLDNPEIAPQHARLNAVCPDESPSTGDMVMNLEKILKRDCGQELSIMEVSRQQYTAQAGPAQELGMTCRETGGILAHLLTEGM